MTTTTDRPATERHSDHYLGDRTAVPFPVVSRVDGIGLDRLVSEAALLTRVDRKYALPAAAAGQVLAELAGSVYMQVLDIDGQRSFGYESLYYDTADLLSYHLAAHGRRRKFKIRRRTYLDSGASFLEVKTTTPRGFTVKERKPIDEADAEFVDGILHRNGFPISTHDLLGTLITRYRRTTLLLPEHQARMTVDTDLTWAWPEHPGHRLDQLTIIETKSGTKASEVDHRLWRAGFRPTRVSKYATGLAAMRSDLPSNRWRPVLRRHFAPLTAAA